MADLTLAEALDDHDWIVHEARSQAVQLASEGVRGTGNLLAHMANALDVLAAEIRRRDSETCDACLYLAGCPTHDWLAGTLQMEPATRMTCGGGVWQKREG